MGRRIENGCTAVVLAIAIAGGMSGQTTSGAAGGSGASGASGKPFPAGHGPGAIMGTVVDSTGKAVDGAVVAAVLQPVSTLPGPFTPYTFTTPTYGGGNFRLIGIPLGRYEICVEQQAQAVINPCVWTAKAVSVMVGGMVPKPQLVVNKGAFITIRVADPSGYLAKPGAVNDILIGTRTGNRPYAAARQISTDSGGATYQMLVPSAQTVGLNVFSAQYQLQDDSGKPLTGSTGTGTVTVTAQPVAVTSAGGASAAARTRADGTTAATTTPTITVHVVGLATKAASGN